MFAALNWASRSWAEALSELTRRSVMTSWGLSSIQVLISESQALSVPASRRLQLVWQRCQAPLFW